VAKSGKFAKSKMETDSIDLVRIMKILIVSNSKNGGGAEAAMLSLFNEFLVRKLDVYLICLNGEPDLLNQSTRVIYLGRRWKSGIIQTLLTFIRFQKLVFTMRANVAILNCELPEMLSAISLWPRCRFYAVEHTTKPWFGREKLGKIIRKILQVKGVQWVSVNSDQKNIWPYSQTSLYIPNGREVPTAYRVKIVRASETNTLVFIGRLRDEKSPETVLRVAKKMNWKVDIFGDGELKANLLSKYPNIINFHGFKNDPWEEISPNKLLVIPSLFEGDGLVVVEAIMRRQPILLRDIPDLRRFELSDFQYFLNEEELREKISHYSNQSINQFKPSIKKSEEMKIFRDPSRVADLWVNLINSLFPSKNH
jgi:glycosyltransferase involved in cell wall biosynthesis